MPKVDTWNTRVQGKGWVKFNINYSSRDRTFNTHLPNWISDTINYAEKIEANTQRELEKKLLKIMEVYGKKTQIKKKVIFYQFLSQVRELAFRNPNSACVSNGEMCSSGVALDLWFEVGYLIDDPTDSFLICTDLHGTKIPFLSTMMRTSHEYPYMDYTEERERFFLAFREYLIDGIGRMRKFFSDTKNVPFLIDDAIQTNLLPYKEEKK